MATLRSTNIASTYFQVKAGGDAAALKGIAKALLQMEEEQVASSIAPLLLRRMPGVCR